MKRALAVLALAWAIAAAGSGAPAGRYLFKAYGPEVGFNEPGLTTLAQDSDGFLWIGCDTGLVRYDGASFHRWTAQDGLPATTVNRVLRRRGGGLWVLTERGLCRFQQGVVTPITFRGKPFLAARGAALDTDSDGVLWALGQDGVYRQNGDQMELLRGFPGGQGRALACRPRTDSVVAVVGGEVWELKRSGAWTRYGREDGLPAETIEAVGADGGGRLWVMGRRALAYLDPRETTFHDATGWLPAAPFASGVINRGVDGWLGIPTNAGLLRLRGDAREVIDEAAGLPCRWTAASLTDREGNLWVLGPGLYRQLGRGFTRAFSSHDGLPSDLVWQVFRDRSGRLFAGTSEGLAILGNQTWAKVPGTDGLAVTGLAEDAQGRILIACNNAVLRTLEPGARAATTAYYESFRAEPGTVKPERSQAVTVGRDGRVWISDPVRGIHELNPATRTLRLSYGPAQDGSADFAAWQLTVDREGRVWAAASSGVLIRDGGGWHRFGKDQGLVVDPLNALALAPDGSAWLFYRESRGASRVVYQGGVFRILEHLGTGNGLATDTIYSGAADAHGALWLGTDRGLEAVQPGRGVYHVPRGAGMVGDDCSQGAILVDPDGDVWVGTSTGLAHLLAGRQPKPLAPLVVTLTQVVQGNQMLVPPFERTQPVSHKAATLEFRFAAPSFVNERAVQYQVRLKGLEDDWRATDVPQARYAALPAGVYRFEARAAYPGMAWGQVASYDFEVLPPWWRTWWFLAMEVLAASGLLWLVTSLRFRNLRRQKERLAEMVERATSDLLKANQALEQANHALQAQSLSDPLTGLHNRRFLGMVVEDDLARVQRAYRNLTPGQGLANIDLVFFMIDVDHFKRINDTYGHGVGDQVLVRVAQVLRKAARETDAVVRWGGEEFLVMARHSSRAEARLMAERIRSLMAEQVLELQSGDVLHWTCSVGFAAYPFCQDDLAWMSWERVVEIADACLYLVKRAGRDGWAGAEALPGLQRAAHGPRLPWELQALADEGVIGLMASATKAERSKGAL